MVILATKQAGSPRHSRPERTLFFQPPTLYVERRRHPAIDPPARCSDTYLQCVLLLKIVYPSPPGSPSTPGARNTCFIRHKFLQPGGAIPENVVASGELWRKCSLPERLPDRRATTGILGTHACPLSSQPCSNHLIRTKSCTQPPYPISQAKY